MFIVKIGFVWLFVLILKLKLVNVNSQYVESPCPDVFSYESNGYTVSGKIVLKGGGTVSQVELQADFSVAGSIPNYGSLELENSNYALQSYNQGYPLVYRVHFPPSSSLPQLTGIRVNGNTICTGPGVPTWNQYISAFNLRHYAYQPTSSQQFSFIQQPQNQNVWSNNYGSQQTYSDTSNQNTWSNRKTTNRPNRPTYEDGTQYYSSNEIQEVSNRYASEQVSQPAVNVYHVPVQTQRPRRPTTRSWYTSRRTTTTQIPYQEQYTTPAPRPAVTQRASWSRPQPLIECGTRATDHIRLPLIYNGNSFFRGEVPWLVAIYRKTRGNLDFICGGTLVSNKHVVTAAHCIWHGGGPSFVDTVVKVGAHNLRDWADGISVIRSLIEATPHDRYNSTSYENDIAILTLNKRVEFNDYIRPACLWNGDITLNRVVGSSGLVAGWGDQNKQGGGAAEPQTIHLPIVDTATCRSSTQAFYDFTSDKTFCAGDRDGSGPCKGDSGSGLYLLDRGKWRIRGLVSVSLRGQDGLCNLNEYIVFTDTAQYLPWIRRILQTEYYD